jgi:hypothetical protein
MAMGICGTGSMAEKRLHNVIPPKPGTMIERGGIWNTVNNSLGLYALQNL